MTQSRNPRGLAFAGLLVDFETGTAWREGELLVLSPLETAVLLYLARNRRQPVSVEELLEAVWGIPLGSGGTPDQVNSYIKRLRQKIEADPRTPQVVVTIRRSGYMLGELVRFAEAR